MSGQAVPYHLRPHKTVDRRLFLDLLARFERWIPLDRYAYISMGAYPLEDHKLVHRVLGITRLIAFDMEPDIVARQKFNRPIDGCHCLHCKSGELIEKLDHVLADCSCSDATGIVVWLDYTDPKQIGQQIREFQNLLGKLKAGDVVRVTINAHPNSLIDPRPAGGRPIPVTEKMDQQYRKLKDRIGEYLPSDTSAEKMTAEDLPLVLSESFGSAALKSLPVTGDTTFSPLSIVRYADGQQMLSITGTLVRQEELEPMLDRLDLLSWPFGSASWKKIHQLVVPALTLRERLFLERGITTRTTEKLIEELGFNQAGDVPIEDFLTSFRDYYRFYPTILAAEF
ncbi:O-methyltransferase [Bradyrhizobium sp. SZCCHNR2012]|uniref:O-methyltransferase n=1 Tax=Bradyrhizobium sp. SZCCHNR2012 TaxID=3057377 RepID=UPI0028EE7D9E|nr:O-methyltransferase [Bradyrhizobium sp. SZCCHNR2012]